MWDWEPVCEEMSQNPDENYTEMQGEKWPNEEDDTHLKILKKKQYEAAREDETSLFLCF
jgi:hypothetical protein